MLGEPSKLFVFASPEFVHDFSQYEGDLEEILFIFLIFVVDGNQLSEEISPLFEEKSEDGFILDYNKFD